MSPRKPTLTPAQIGRARRDYAAGRLTMRDLADRYGVALSTIHHALAGIRPDRRGYIHTGSPARDARIRAAYAAGQTLSALAAQYGLTRQRIHQIVRSNT
jgi:transcriptional regulator with XRE-family HTH domain